MATRIRMNQKVGHDQPKIDEINKAFIQHQLTKKHIQLAGGNLHFAPKYKRGGSFHSAVFDFGKKALGQIAGRTLTDVLAGKDAKEAVKKNVKLQAAYLPASLLQRVLQK